MSDVAGGRAELTSGAEPTNGLYARILFWLGVVAFFGLAMNLTLEVGSYKSFVNVIQLLAIIQIGWCIWQYRRVPRSVGWLAVVPATFLLCDMLAPDGAYNKYAVRNLFAAFALAAVIATLPQFWPERYLRYIRWLVFGVVVVGTWTQIVAMTVFGERFGVHENPHFLNLQAVVSIPVALFFVRQAPRWQQALAIATALAALSIILVTGSTIGALSVFVGALVAVCLYRPKWTTLLAAGVLLAAGAGVVAVQDHKSVDPAMRAIVAGSEPVVRDERVVLWEDAWRMQKDSGAVQWLVGHGMGGFDEHFPAYSRLDEVRHFVFPHNFLLEVLFNSGLVGLLVFAGSLGALMWQIVLAARAGLATAPLLGALLCAALLFTFLTLPLLARHTTYTLGISVGVALACLHGTWRRA